MVCWHTMKRTTIKLPDDLDACLRRQADLRGITVSEITREAIRSYLDGAPRTLLAAGVGHSGQIDVSERIEEILQQELQQ